MSNAAPHWYIERLEYTYPVVNGVNLFRMLREASSAINLRVPTIICPVVSKGTQCTLQAICRSSRDP
jgi:hypothetical protein